MCVYTALNLENIGVWRGLAGWRGERLHDADGLAGRMRTGPRAPSGLAWSPRPRRKVEKNPFNTLTLALSQSISTCRMTHTHTHKHRKSLTVPTHTYTYTHTHLQQACLHNRESIVRESSAAWRRGAISLTCMLFVSESPLILIAFRVTEM